MHAIGSLGSAKPGHIKPSDQSAVKRLTGYQGQGCHIEFRLNINFMQTTQRIFNFTDIQVLYIFLDKNLDISHTLPRTVTKLSTLKKTVRFWPTLYFSSLMRPIVTDVPWSVCLRVRRTCWQ